MVGEGVCPEESEVELVPTFGAGARFVVGTGVGAGVGAGVGRGVGLGVGLGAGHEDGTVGVVEEIVVGHGILIGTIAVLAVGPRVGTGACCELGISIVFGLEVGGGAGAEIGVGFGSGSA